MSCECCSSQTLLSYPLCHGRARSNTQHSRWLREKKVRFRIFVPEREIADLHTLRLPVRIEISPYVPDCGHSGRLLIESQRKTHHEEEEGQPLFEECELTVGIVDGEEWEWEIEYEEHHIQQLRRKGDSASRSNKSDHPHAWTDL